MNMSDRYRRLLNRRAPSEDRLLEKYAEAFEHESGESTRYILGALKPVDEKYTNRLIEQGNRIENQLQKRLDEEYWDVNFRRQGSVSNRTHIRYHSDVDVLVITEKFFTLEHPQKPQNPYQGNPIDDLFQLRRKCAKELSLAFPKTTIDDTGASSLSISGGSLACKVDVVPANWYDTNSYSETGYEYLRGIQILNIEERKRKKNYPFLFNRRIEDRDKTFSGVPRMLIRLLKNISADAEEDDKDIDFSSFDICSLVYRMPNTFMNFTLNEPLVMVESLLLWMKEIYEKEDLRNSLNVVDDSRKIFDSPEKFQGFCDLTQELLDLYNSAMKENSIELYTESHF